MSTITELKTLNYELTTLLRSQNLTKTCEFYAGIKVYQYMLHQFLGIQNTSNISNVTLLSILYLLQNAGESLQTIQVSKRLKIIIFS